MPYEGSLKHQGIVSRKDMIHFIQVFERLSYQQKLDSSHVIIRAEKVFQEDKIQFNVRKPCLQNNLKMGWVTPVRLNPSSLYISGDLQSGVSHHLDEESWHVCEGNSW